uniref:proline-rich protein 2-like n=1 Tax=Podarcis muralis TaxID=64176 RepID=UPI0010A021E1|nr:proline-rich protein 2-like [Podarcis muralis]
MHPSRSGLPPSPPLGPTRGGGGGSLQRRPLQAPGEPASPGERPRSAPPPTSPPAPCPPPGNLEIDARRGHPELRRRPERTYEKGRIPKGAGRGRSSRESAAASFRQAGRRGCCCCCGAGEAERPSRRAPAGGEASPGPSLLRVSPSPRLPLAGRLGRGWQPRGASARWRRRGGRTCRAGRRRRTPPPPPRRQRCPDPALPASAASGGRGKKADVSRLTIASPRSRQGGNLGGQPAPFPGEERRSYR